MFLLDFVCIFIGLLCGADQFELPELEDACWEYIERRLLTGSAETMLQTTRLYTHHRMAKCILDKVGRNLHHFLKSMFNQEWYSCIYLGLLNNQVIWSVTLKECFFRPAYLLLFINKQYFVYCSLHYHYALVLLGKIRPDKISLLIFHLIFKFYKF